MTLRIWTAPTNAEASVVFFQYTSKRGVKTKHALADDYEDILRTWYALRQEAKEVLKVE